MMIASIKSLLIDISNALALNTFDNHSKYMWKDPLKDTFHKIPVNVSSWMPALSSICTQEPDRLS